MKTMTTKVSSCDLVAEQFLKETGTTFKAEYIDHDFYFADDKECRDIYRITLKRNGKSYTFKFGQSIANVGHAPTAYDVLACVEKGEIGTFEEFCGSFGYDTDSRKAEKIYKAVCREYKGITRLFGDVMEQLLDVQ